MCGMIMFGMAVATMTLGSAHGAFDSISTRPLQQGGASFITEKGERVAYDADDLPEASVAKSCLPASCTCVDGVTNPTASDSCCTEGRFECGCQCDVTAGMCDPNCCCDPECSDAERALFEGSCLPQASSALSIPVCVSSSTFEAVATNQYGVQEASSAREGFLCIEAIRNPSMGTFFTPPGKLSASYLSRSNIQPLNAFARAKAISDGGADVNRAKYDIGDRMQAAFASSEVSAFGGFAPLPTAGPDGRCVDTNYMRYRVPVTSNSCPRRGTCEGAFDHAAYISDLRVKASYANKLGHISQRRSEVDQGRCRRGERRGSWHWHGHKYRPRFQRPCQRQCTIRRAGYVRTRCSESATLSCMMPPMRR